MDAPVAGFAVRVMAGGAGTPRCVLLGSGMMAQGGTGRDAREAYLFLHAPVRRVTPSWSVRPGAGS